ncbi:MAG: replication restart helicase PriA, partial [Bacteroidales bacterium]
LKKAPRQYALLSAYLKINSYTYGIDIIPVRKSILLKESGSLSSSAATLEKKGIFISLELEAGTEEKTNNEAVIPEPLSETQAQVYNKIKEQLKRKNILLLHGVTYGGKKQIYIHLIKEYLTMGKQVLYLLPEIASTSQIIRRLRRYFGPVTDICHSRLSETQKLKLWKKIAEKDPEKRTGLTVGTRSSIFLPFSDLGLIIVDDEHEVLYKQQDPAPRYHARDSAIMLGSFTGAVTVLGSATPSVESYYNAMTGKYGFTEIRERYGRINLPEIILVNTREAYRKKMMVSHFSPQLLEAIEQALQKREQVLIFRNRRGFSPYLQCGECGWILTCSKCAVNLTYHREMNRMICHYCSSVYSVPSECPSCGSLSVETRGYGTEKIEDEIKLLFPGTKVARMDKDTTHRADSVNSILKDFEDNRIDILVGTQMISRSLSTENLTVTGILNIDSIMNIPDFRAHERAFQFIAQVTGKTGRKNKQGKVIIQSYDPNHRIMKYLLRNDYRGFYEAQLEERKTFNYPPFCRLVKITMKHKDKRLLNEFADRLCEKLREHFEDRVLGPEFPVISRIQLWYLKEILIKIERDKSFHQARGIIRESIDEVTSMKGTTMLKVLVDVDPY